MHPQGHPPHGHGGHPGGHPGTHPGGHPHGAMNGSDGPVPRLIAWETTRRCHLRCKHCRGAALNQAYEGELSTEEGFKFIDNVASFSKPILILTGGEPMSREDIYDIARYGTDKGLRCVMSPCGAMINPVTAKKIKDSGIQRISISLDGASSETHDDFRGIKGAFNDALNGIQHAVDAGIEFQINTTITKHNLHELPQILELCQKLGAAAFNPFMLVPTGRGSALKEMEVSPAEYEKTLVWIYEKSKELEMVFKPTCAPHYYRIFRQKEEKEGREVTPQSHGLFAMTKGCMGGQGFVFMSYKGTFQICGFLDVECGDLRKENFDFKKIYQTSEVFLEMRNQKGYHGKCGVCEYGNCCGGCRARAMAFSGDYLGEEPFCVYIPKVMREKNNG